MRVRPRSWTDIHCHVVPGLDDGAADMAEALAMVRMAVADGTTTLIATPHQLGANAHVTAEAIRTGVAALQAAVDAAGIAAKILAGADVRIEPELPSLVKQGKVVTLADRGRHLLLELPHEIYFPLGSLLEALDRRGVVGILSHPERNRGIIREPDVMHDVVAAGGLLQITAGSLLGGFGTSARRLAESAVRDRIVHFVASDAHDTARRPFGLAEAFDTVAGIADEDYASLVCSINPGRVARGEPVETERPRVRSCARPSVFGFLRRVIS
jgi:protein-tyrosine phosphatase